MLAGENISGCEVAIGFSVEVKRSLKEVERGWKVGEGINTKRLTSRYRLYSLINTYEATSHMLLCV